MITKLFLPSIPSEDIEETLNTTEGLGFPEHIQTELSRTRRNWLLLEISVSVFMLVGGSLVACMGWMDTFGGAVIPGFGFAYLIGGVVIALAAPLWLIKSLLRMFTRPSQATPEATARVFYSEIMCTMFPDYSRAYRILAPSAMKKAACSSVSEFTNPWKSVKLAIPMALLEKGITCSLCGKEGSGLWTVEPVNLPDQQLKSSKVFLRCYNCSAVYCANCFIKLEGKRECHSCKEPLKGILLKILMVKPNICVSFDMESTTIVDQETERVTRVVCELKGTSLYKPPWSEDFEAMGEQGALTCRFQNIAVKIGAKWYLLAGEPGTMS